jgi:hypothetical protein
LQRIRQLGIGAVLTAAAIALALIAARTADGRAAAYEPASAVLRPALQPVIVPGGGSVLDFDWYDDQLYLLDPLEHSVTVLRQHPGGGWDRVLRFGRYGGGPGELLRPTGIARLRDPAAIAVVDQARVHLFDLGGAHLVSHPLGLPCALPLPRIAAARSGLLVHGDCLLRSGRGDTVFAVLFWSADGGKYREVAREARFTTDGRYGHGFGARSALTPGDHHHLFGAGVSGCLWRIDDVSAPEAHRSCTIQDRAFPLRLRPATRRALERRLHGPGARLPQHFAWYEERFPGRTDLLLRPFSEDSVVVRHADGSADLAVLPLSGLVGCRAGGCVYSEPAAETLRLRLLPAATLAALAAPNAH